ncbi:MAG TPA: ABC transporter ATP-binding protein [Anaerolineales bacterium]|nr:ABC transporter ATP-binding protein [Anaerolineales bacterium]
MADFILRTENLSKRYRILPTAGRGWRGNQRVLVDDIARIANRIRGREFTEKRISFWALKDVSFEAKSGDVIGVIGRNGAGKSTLLKLLGRVTEPTAGRAIIYGRVGSLLEVGTGFHSELTGRENIFISGAIIGMSRAEIKRKFDEIVAFSGVEEFLDTPVKRYSSGMEVRLAFSIAAHLQPQVLLVDEVLAVGDASFQQKSLQKIKQVSENGGTILFISHNMSTIASLCNQAIVLDQGKVVFELGPVTDAINSYLSGVAKRQLAQLEETRQEEEPGPIKISAFSIRGPDGTFLETLTSGAPMDLQLDYKLQGPAPIKDVNVSILIKTLKGEVIASLDNQATIGPLTLSNREGRINCHIDKLPLTSGNICISLLVEQTGRLVDRIEDAFIGDIDRGGVYDRRKSSDNRGWVLIDQDWSVR